MTDIFKKASGALAMMAMVLGTLVVQPVPAQAKTYNACGIEYGVRDKKIKDGKAVVVKGTLKKRIESGHVYWSLLNDSGSCDVMIYGDEKSDKMAANCGDGAKVKIIGMVKITFVFPEVKPDLVSCNW